MAETFTCPMGAGKPILLTAEWRADRWCASEEEAAAEMEQFASSNPGGSIASPLWRGPGPLPRTCSFCGGVHPEDAIALVSLGWEVEATTKGHKRYLTPPGTATRNRVMMERLDEGRDPVVAVPSVWSPGPPVKLYIAHFSEAQATRFNDTLSRGAR